MSATAEMTRTVDENQPKSTRYARVEKVLGIIRDDEFQLRKGFGDRSNHPNIWTLQATAERIVDALEKMK